VGKDGSITTAMAVQAFGLAVSPLPGEVVPSATGGRLEDGTVAVQWAVAELATMSPPQRQAVQRMLAPGGPAPGTLTTLAQRARSQIAASMGRDTGQDIEVVLSQGAGSLAYAGIFDNNWSFSGRPAQCIIYVNPLLLGDSPTEIESVVDHEVFHCFEADDFATVLAYVRTPAWLIDGASQWAGDELDPINDPWYAPYLTEIGTPLFQRTYDAVGFFAHMTETGTNPWTRIDAMLKAGGSPAAFHVGANRAFQDSWASSLARQPFGSGWQTSGPGIPKVSYHPPIGVVRDGSVVSGEVAPYTNALAAVDVAADVVNVTVANSQGRLHSPDGSEHDGTVLEHAEFCVTSACSACPDLASLARLPTGPAWLAVTGDDTGTRYTISGMKAECGACPIGEWTSTSYSDTGPSPSGSSASPGLSGGAGAAVNISPAGSITIDYTGAGPLSISGGGTGVLTGRQSGPFPVPRLAAKTGTFPAPTGSVSLRVRSGSNLDSSPGFHPFGGTGPVTWTCSGGSMTFTGSGPATVRWTLARNP
jgi:hypothetical protein